MACRPDVPADGGAGARRPPPPRTRLPDRGLPLLYHEDGGGIVELGRRYGIGFRDDVAGAIGEMRSRYADLRRTVLDDPPSGDEMCRRYRAAIDALAAGR